MGVSGAGKTTVGKRLAQTLNWPFLEGDDLHPARNMAKMRAGVPLTDADREPWLARVAERIEEYLAAGQPAVIACSALRSAYRQRLRIDPAVRFVYLTAKYALLHERLKRRRNHFMKASMLKSQIEQLEEPIDVVTIDATMPVDEIVSRIRAELALS